MLGSVFNKIVRDQFIRLRSGDRFWYENRLTYEQITLVQQTTFSDIISRNTCLNDVPKNVFQVDKQHDCCDDTCEEQDEYYRPPHYSDGVKYLHNEHSKNIVIMNVI